MTRDRVSKNTPAVREEELIAGAERAIGVQFKDKTLLKTALTHPSFANETPTTQSNQRLEFLGDRVIDFAVTEYLYESMPGMSAGDLSALRIEAVRGETLTDVATRIGIGEYLLFGRGEQELGGSRESNLEDAFEAVAGAVFIDKGFNRARDFVLKHLQPCIQEALKSDVPLQDPKSLLQEHTQRLDGSLPVYVTKVADPSDDGAFKSTVVIGGSVAGTGVGRRKMEAEREAALQALATL